jgi:hypothetical protein
VFHGRIDFLFRDARRSWCSVVLSDAAANESLERLRLLLSAYAARDLGIKKITRGWRVRLGPGGGVSEEKLFSNREIERAIQVVTGSPGPLFELR